MRRFAALFRELDTTTSTADKVAAMVRYFGDAPDADAAWATYFLCGGKPRQVVPVALLRALACGEAGIDDWLFEECYQAVGDLAETIALVLPGGRETSDAGLAHWVEDRLLPLRDLAPEAQAAQVAQAWRELDAPGRFLLVKLIGGGFRVGVSRLLVQRALAEHAGLDPKLVAQRLMGWTDGRARPGAARFAALIAPAQQGAALEAGQPYPFFLAHALQEPVERFGERLGPVTDWMAEWKYDGIRAQLVRRGGAHWVWSRGEELMTERFPELAPQAAALPEGTVLDGEILVWREGADAPSAFQLLQQRIGRKTITRKVLADAPVRFLAYDLLEHGGIDLRSLPQHERRRRLEALLAHGPLPLSPRVEAADWDALATMRAQSRERGVEGLMLKHRDARYGSGRTRADGTWWKWKIDPLTADGVLVYAQAGHGRRASLYTDYTFAVWNRPPRDADEAAAVVEAIARGVPAPRDDEQALQLVPFAKA
jgi:DNA ligase-1